MANNLSRATLGVRFALEAATVEKVARCSTLYTEQGFVE
jgi:hypothetical protein